MATRLAVQILRLDLDHLSVAKLVGSSRAFISMLVRGERSASPEMAERIASALDCRVEDLFEVRKGGKSKTRDILWPAKEVVE